LWQPSQPCPGPGTAARAVIGACRAPVKAACRSGHNLKANTLVVRRQIATRFCRIVSEIHKMDTGFGDCSAAGTGPVKPAHFLLFALNSHRNTIFLKEKTGQLKRK
jgi:hypothetical protein